jgi:molecular chaperone GrpE
MSARRSVHDTAKAVDARGSTPETEAPAEELSCSDAAVERDESLHRPRTGPGHGELNAAGEQLRVELDLDELAARAEKADEYLELARRTRADFENYRKRATREFAAAQERGIARLAKELLPAIDNLDRAVRAALAESVDGEDSASTPDAQLVSGIRLVQADVTAALGRVGIESFSPVGEPFDPQYHEAVAQAPFEGATPGTVAEVYQPGYRIGETVLRPARVVVAA